MKTLRYGILLAVLATSLPATTHAGIYADELAKCLVESTSPTDRINLVQWMFSAASLHPAVKPLSSVTDDQRDATNKVIADLIMKLLTASCRAETEKALQYEGPSTMETAFTVLGQVAGQELFTSAEVSAGLAGLEKHLDSEALDALIKSD